MKKGQEYNYQISIGYGKEPALVLEPDGMSLHTVWTRTHYVKVDEKESVLERISFLVEIFETPPQTCPGSRSGMEMRLKK